MSELFNTSFVIQEFVPPETYMKWGDRSIWFVRKNIVLFSQWLKDSSHGTGTVTINNWLWNGGFKYSGYRPPDCLIGAKESSHRRCDAIDVRVSTMEPREVEQLIRDNFLFLNSEFGYTGIELDTPSWTHHDFRCTGVRKLLEIPFK